MHANVLKHTNNMVCRHIALFAVSVLFFFFIMLCAPYASDDYEFYSKDFQNPQQILEYALYYGNGRLLGNMGAVFLVAHPILCAFIKSLVISSIILLLPMVLGIRSSMGYLLSFLLLVMIDPSLFAQVYTWTSGFQNYVPPILIALLVIYAIQRYPEMKSQSGRILVCIGISILGIAGQLYVEHASIITLLIATHHVWNSLKSKQKHSALPCWIWFLSAFSGLVMMFAIPIVFYVDGNRSTGYRSFNTDSLENLIHSCISTALELTSYYSSFAIVIVFTAIVVSIYLTRKSRTDKNNRYMYGLIIVSTVYLLLNDILCDNTWYGALSTPRKLVTFGFVFLQFVVWVTACRHFDKSMRNTVLSLIGYAFVALAALLIVSPTPLRVIYLPYILIVAAALICICPLQAELNSVQKHCARFLTKTVTVILIILLCAMFLNINWLNNVRKTYIIQQMEDGAAEIDIFAIPYDYAYWDGVWCFKKEYHYIEPGDIVFTESDFNAWMDSHYAEIYQKSVDH